MSLTNEAYNSLKKKADKIDTKLRILKARKEQIQREINELEQKKSRLYNPFYC